MFEPRSIEKSSASIRFIVSIWREDFSNDRIPRFVRHKRRSQELKPLFVLAAAFDQHDVECVGHSEGIAFIGEQTIDQHRTLIGFRIFEKSSGFVRSW